MLALERMLSWARDAAPPTLAAMYENRMVSWWYGLPAAPCETLPVARDAQAAPCGPVEAPTTPPVRGSPAEPVEDAPPAGAAPSVPGGRHSPERRRAQLLERIRRKDPELADLVESGELTIYGAGRKLGLVKRYVGKQARRDRERKQHRERALRRIAERDPELAKLARRGDVPLARACQQVGLSKHGTVREPEGDQDYNIISTPEPEPEPEPAQEPARRHPSKYADEPEGVQRVRDEHETRSLRQQDAEFVASTIGHVRPELLERTDREFQGEVGRLARKRGRYR